jgi:hypothetical protein
MVTVKHIAWIGVFGDLPDLGSICQFIALGVAITTVWGTNDDQLHETNS